MIEFDEKRYAEFSNRGNFAWRFIESRIFDHTLKNYLPSKPVRNLAAIDLGTGTGVVARKLIEAGFLPPNILAVDRSEYLMNALTFPDGVRKLKSDLTDIDSVLNRMSRDSKIIFDVAVSNMVFNLLTLREYVESLHQLREHLHIGSMLAIVVPHPLRESMMSLEDYKSKEMLREPAPWGGWVCYFPKTLTDYKEGLNKSGFKIVGLGATALGIDTSPAHFASEKDIYLELIKRRVFQDAVSPHHFRLWMIAKSV